MRYVEFDQIVEHLPTMTDDELADYLIMAVCEDSGIADKLLLKVINQCLRSVGFRTHLISLIIDPLKYTAPKTEEPELREFVDELVEAARGKCAVLDIINRYRKKKTKLGLVGDKQK